MSYFVSVVIRGAPKGKDKVMRTKLLAVAATGALALGLVACSDSGDDPSGASGKIAVLLPDSTTSARWETADRVFFEQAFKDAGLSPDDYIINNAEGDPSVQRSQAEQAITAGAKVIVLVNLDQGSGQAIIDDAKAQGVSVIDYDRLTVGGKADYYISGGAYDAGVIQGQGVVDALAGVDNPTIAILNGDPTDSFAVDLADGYLSVLEPLEQQGKLTLVGKETNTQWDGTVAQTLFEGMLAQFSIDGAIAANDNLANSVITSLKSQGKPMIPVSGLDGEIRALQHILAGDQAFTVYFSYGTQATTAGKLAVQLLRGENPTGIDGSVNNEGVTVPAVLLAPVKVTKDNIEQTVIADGLITWADICVGDYAQYCSQ